jgi:hypothetical protein
MINYNYLNVINKIIDGFINWLDKYGEESYDHQTYYASKIGRTAKALYYKSPIVGMIAVSPMVFSEAFIPYGRKIFWQKQRLPISDAHYAMGFAYLYDCGRINKKYYERAIHFLEVLEETRCPNYSNYCWGYPFDWETRNGTIEKGTPLITTTPYAYEAFSQIYKIDKKERWKTIMKSIAEHACHDIKDFIIGDNAATCSYTPFDKGGVVNASAYRAFLLTIASKDLNDEKYLDIAKRNLKFVIKCQKENGSWLYAIDDERDFVDHFHTCFVLKALVKIDQLIDNKECKNAIEKGINYYVNNLFDNDGLPKPFSKAPRLTVYKNELYDYAECINLCALLLGRYKNIENILERVINDLHLRWIKRDGSFKSRKLLIGWDRVPMHRWAQSQLFRSLCFLLYLYKETN